MNKIEKNWDMKNYDVLVIIINCHLSSLAQLWQGGVMHVSQVENCGNAWGLFFLFRSILGKNIFLLSSQTCLGNFFLSHNWGRKNLSGMSLALETSD